MNKEDFKILLGSYGANLMRWPEILRNAAAPLFAQFPALVEDAAAVDGLLNSYKLSDIRPDFLDEVIAATHVAHNDNNAVWKRIAMLSACAFIGFWCGNVSLQVETNYASQENSMKPLLLGTTKLSEVML